MIEFKTESGSWYAIDDDAHTWSRPHNPKSTQVRTEEGTFWERSPIVVGRSVTLICPPIIDHSVARMIRTTPVVKIVSDE